MGGVIVDLEKDKQENLYNFGIDLGILFQIQDDIIDETQSEKEAGKTIKNDGDKNSFVNLMGLDGSMDEADKLAVNLENRLKSFDEPLKKTLNPIIDRYLYRHKFHYKGKKSWQ